MPTNNGTVAERDRVIFTFLLGTGIRLGSLVGTHVGDLHLNEGYVDVRAKGGVKQQVCLGSRLRRLLKSYIGRAQLRHEDPLFPSRNSGPLSARQVQLRFKYWLERAGIKRHLTVHSLRHTFAMNLYRRTRDLRLVQTALGHKRITTTEIYARTDDRMLKRALEKV